MIRAPVLFLMALFLVIVTLASGAQADPMAESLYADGKALLDEGKAEEACPKLEASHKREPKSGTLITLGFCHEKLGLLATAWAEYMDAIALANQEGRPEFADNAKSFADAIAPKLSKLTVSVEPQPPEAELTVAVDGKPLFSGSFGTPVAIDPGTHSVTASAPGFISWEGSVTVAPDADRQSITVPALQMDPNAAPPPEPPAPPPTPPPAPERAPDKPISKGGEGIAVWAWVAGGIGVAATIASAVFLADTLSAKGTLDDRCGKDRQSCPLDYDFEPDRTREERGEALFIGFGVAGVVGIGAGLVGIILGVSGDEPTAVMPQLGPGLAGVTLHASFH